MPSTELTIQTELASLFSEQLKVHVASAETDLVDAGILDSLKFVELLVELERRFGVQISTDDLELDHFRSIQKISQFVARRTGSNGPV